MVGPKFISDDELLSAIKNTESYAAAARSLGIHRRTLYRRLEYIKQGRSVDQKKIHHPPMRDDEIFRKRSILWSPTSGETKLEWFCTDRDKQAQYEAMKAAADALKEDLPILPKIKAPKTPHNDLLNLFILTDAHIGMLAWGEETGEDWDTSLAREMILRYFSVAIEKAPDAERAVFAQLGDFLHYDGIDSVTPANKHQLDTDSRFAKLVRLGIVVTREVVEMLLKKYASVDVIMAEGNHDPVSEIWLRESFADRYRKQDRLRLDTSPKPFYAVEHGRTSLFFHHGHLKKVDQIDRALTAEFRELFGRTKYSYCHVGHLHHHLVKETELMKVEQHSTLSARDAYASRHLFRSARQAQVITYHAIHGDVGRLVITPEQLES